MFTKSVTIYKTIMFNVSKWSEFESMIFKKLVNIMSCNVTE